MVTRLLVLASSAARTTGCLQAQLARVTAWSKEVGSRMWMLKHQGWLLDLVRRARELLRANTAPLLPTRVAPRCAPNGCSLGARANTPPTSPSSRPRASKTPSCAGTVGDHAAVGALGTRRTLRPGSSSFDSLHHGEPLGHLDKWILRTQYSAQSMEDKHFKKQALGTSVISGASLA